MFLAVEQTPGANPLTVSKQVLALLPDIKAQLPTGLRMDLAVDFSEYISESIAEVFWTLGETVLIVLLVVLISLGSLRAAVIPAGTKEVLFTFVPETYRVGSTIDGIFSVLLLASLGFALWIEFKRRRA